MRQTVDAEVKRAKSDSEIEVKELYYDIYEQVIHHYSLLHQKFTQLGIQSTRKLEAYLFVNGLLMSFSTP